MGLFSKKTCSICGGDIGLFGNRKLEDGNMCKKCAAKLSPWFSDRRSSTVVEILEQLDYREANKEKVAAFHPTKTLGNDSVKLLVDEEAKTFTVTRARDLNEANPDILSLAQIKSVDFQIEESQDEEKLTNAEGKRVSYDPPRYQYGYDFKVRIYVEHPYFDDMYFDLNPMEIKTTDLPVAEKYRPDPKTNEEYRTYARMGQEVESILTGKPLPPEEKPPVVKPANKPASGPSVNPNADMAQTPVFVAAKPKTDEKWKCSACGTLNTGKFCSECGAKKPDRILKYKCDKCGWVPEDPSNPPRFCPNCGDAFSYGDIQK